MAEINVFFDLGPAVSEVEVHFRFLCNLTPSCDTRHHCVLQGVLLPHGVKINVLFALVAAVAEINSFEFFYMLKDRDFPDFRDLAVTLTLNRTFSKVGSAEHG